MKSIHLNRITDQTFVDELKNEIEILKQLDHPYIVRPIETFDHRNQLFIVMELCSGGDLYSRDPYTEEEAARITSSILSAISYMHHRGIVHRDLKYENILFVSDNPKAEVKLIDFGLSKTYSHSGQNMTEGVGTIYTMAPEVLRGNYTSQADLWSVGVIAYMLLSSQMPFYGRKRRHIVEQIMQCKYDFGGRRWKRISPQAKAFVDDLLVDNPDERATAEEAAASTWLNKRYGATVRAPTEDELDTTVNCLSSYSHYAKLKKLVSWEIWTSLNSVLFILKYDHDFLPFMFRHRHSW
jgi:serine/threonine protein kinase